MDSLNESLFRMDAPPTKYSLSYNVVSMAGGMLLVADIFCLLLAAFLGVFFYAQWMAPPLSFAPDGFLQAALIAAVLAPFILYDQRFGTVASRGQIPVLVRSYALRFTLFAGVVLGVGILCQALNKFPGNLLALWFATTFMLTSLTRVLATQLVRRLQYHGVLTEVIAVVGAGPVADRLIQALRRTRSDTIELIGIFDDEIEGRAQGMIKPTGNIEQLIELGKTRKIDWILLTLPASAERQVHASVHRLKALAVPIGLCPQHVELAVPYRTIDYVGGSVPVSLLTDAPVKPRDAMIKAAEEFLPRWIVTLTLLPLALLEVFAAKLVTSADKKSQPRTASRSEKLILQIDNYDLAGFTKVAAGFGQHRYGYVVTPNADHFIRLHESASFRAIYAAASYVLLDSRFLSKILRVSKGLQLPVCTGSDLTAKLFSDVISSADRLVIIGGSDEQARKLSQRYGLRNLAHFNPPMGFIHDPVAVETTLKFIESHSPFRFCLLAVGTPQGEAIAQKLKERGIARGLTLCIGASINFLTGEERRAPVWMQQSGLEWLYRLVRAPARLAKRYLVRGPRVFGLLRNTEIVLRKSSTPVLRLVPKVSPLALPAPSTTSSGSETAPRGRLKAVPNHPAAAFAAAPPGASRTPDLKPTKPDRAVNAS